MLGLVEPRQLHWDHVDYRFGIVAGHESNEETDERDGRKCYI